MPYFKGEIKKRKNFVTSLGWLGKAPPSPLAPENTGWNYGITRWLCRISAQLFRKKRNFAIVLDNRQPNILRMSHVWRPSVTPYSSGGICYEMESLLNS